MAPSRLEFPGLSGSIATEPQSSIPIQLASLFYSSLAISTPSPQARASLIGVAIATGGNILISVALNVQKLSHMRLADQKSSSRPNSEVRNGNRTSDDDYHGLQSNQSERGEEAISDGDEDGSASGLDETAPLTPSPANRTYGGLDSNGQKSSNVNLPSLNNRIKSNFTSIGSISNGRADLEGIEIGNSRFKRNDRENSEEDFNHSSGPGSEFLRSRLWWFGISLMTLGEAGNFLSYGFAPASLVAPLGAVALLSNVLISPLLLGPQEKFSKSDFGGMLLATIGAVTVVFSSKESNARLGPDELLEAIKRLEFFIYAAISAFFAAILMLLSRTRLAERFVLIDVGVCALFGGFTVLSTKGLSSLLAARHPLDVIKYPITYVLLAILASTAVAQITYLNRALYRFDSREVIPTQFVFFTISAIVGSAVLYRDFENVEPHRFINFIFGCLTTFAGVFILTRSRGSGSEAADEEGEEVSDSTTPSPISTPKRRGRRRTSRAGSQSSKYLQIPGEDGSQELDLDPSRAVKVDILTPVTPTSEAEREDALTPLVSTSLKPSHPGMISSMTTGSVPLSSSGSRRPRPSKSNQKDLSGSLPSSSTTPTLNETANAFNRNHRLSFPGPRSSPRTTPGLGFSAGHYLLLATPSGSNSNSQGLLVPLDSTGKSHATRHVRTRSQSTPGNRRKESERDHQRRNREESSEGNVGNSRSGDGHQQQDGSSQADESQEIGDLEMDFEEDQSPKRRSTRE